jgi:prophage antirepressor-like protein
VSESGLDRLIFRSHKPEALAFQDWVTRVLHRLRSPWTEDHQGMDDVQPLLIGVQSPQ